MSKRIPKGNKREIQKRKRIRAQKTMQEAMRGLIARPFMDRLFFGWRVIDQSPVIEVRWWPFCLRINRRKYING